MSKWLWLDRKAFSEYSPLSREYYVAEFVNTVTVKDKQEITIKACADARYLLYINGKFIGRGPVSAGGDFLWPKMRFSYFDEYKLTLQGIVEIRMVVASVPSVLCESSLGQSGMYFEALSSQNEPICVDKEWLARPLVSCVRPDFTDYTMAELSYAPATCVPDVYNAKKSPLEHLTEIEILPTTFDKITLDSPVSVVTFDKIYSAYPEVSLKTDGRVRVILECEEIDGVGRFVEEFVSDTDVIHSSPRLRSVGQIKITLENISAKNALIDDVKIIYSAYPVKNEAGFKCSDKLLERIYELCIHTLKICRRDIHLDSPTHQEHLACTGDYYIQALMEYVNMYDPTLTAFDIYRTAQLLEIQNGRLFHTTYSLIFPEWLYDYYMFTADKELLKECKSALEFLFARFDGYMGENGLVEGAPDYMFVDWILLNEKGENTDPTYLMSHGKSEGFSMHHPPKALGQSVLCMFYYNALIKGARLYEILDDSKSVDMCLKKAQNLKNAINTHLYDKSRELYVGGLNTPNKAPSGEWLPENTDMVFYLKQANVLSVLYDIAPRQSAKKILEYTVKGLKKEEMQPYFYHFLLEALIKEDMFEEYGLNLVRRYESMLKKCDKGLCEAWEMFPSDCSHAWGGSPAYILKKAISGFEMLEAGYKKVRLSPRLFDLDSAELEISTPYGAIKIKATKQGITVTSPTEIQIEMEN